MNYLALTDELVAQLTINLKNYMDAPTMEATLRAFDLLLDASMAYTDENVVPGT